MSMSTAKIMLLVYGNRILRRHSKPAVLTASIRIPGLARGKTHGLGGQKTKRSVGSLAGCR